MQKTENTQKSDRMQKNKKTEPVNKKKASYKSDIKHITVLGFANNAYSVAAKVSAKSKKNS
jgi:hypothetical protein